MPVLLRLLLLPHQRGTQQQKDRLAIDDLDAAYVAAARAGLAGHRRFADQTLRPESRRSRRSSQSNTGPGRSTVLVWPCVGDDLFGGAASPVGPLALPLRAMLYVRQQTMATIPPERLWYPFATKLQLAARLVAWAVPLLKSAGKTVWVVVDGGYTKAPFLKRVLRLHRVVVVGRMRKDAALRDLPPKRTPRRGRPRKYGKTKSAWPSALVRRVAGSMECTVYNKTSTKRYKTFLATYKPAGGVIRIVLVKEEHGWYAFYCTDPSATAQEIVEAFGDRATIEQDFHDVKEVWGAGQQQVRNIWTNLAVYNMNLWMHSLLELWAWNRSAKRLADRSDSPWDDAARRPSHANRRKALRRRSCATNYRRLLPTGSSHEK